MLKQRDSSNFELNQVIKMIGNETLRLVKQEKKRNKQDFQPSQSPARQIIECQSSILKYVFFGQSTKHQFTSESQFRYNKYLDFQRRQLKASFEFSDIISKATGPPANEYVCMLFDLYVVKNKRTCTGTHAATALVLCHTVTGMSMK